MYVKETWRVIDTKASSMALFEALDPAISEGRHPLASTSVLLTFRIVERCSLELDNVITLSQPLSCVSQYLSPPSFVFSSSQYEEGFIHLLSKDF